MPIFVPKEFSFNPRSLFCPICRLDQPEQVLMVGEVHKFICIHCQMLHLGQPDDEKCVRCGCNVLEDKGVPPEDEKFAAPDPCAPCRTNLTRIGAVVALGGLAWRCKDCGAHGAFDHNNPVVPEFRARFTEPNAMWELDQPNCPSCRNEKPNPSGPGELSPE